MFLTCLIICSFIERIFEELQRIPRSRDLRDVVEALKHVYKQQTPRFGVII